MRFVRVCSTMILLAPLAGALAQPVRDAHPDDRADERDQAAQMIHRQLARLETQQQRLETALDQLQSGAPLEEIHRLLSDRGDDAADKPLTDHQRDEFLTLFAELNPELYERWRRMSENNPRLADRMRQKFIQRMRSDPGVRELIGLRQSDPDRFRARLEQLRVGRLALAAARQFVDATVRGDQAAADAARAEVRTSIDRQFTLRLAEQRLLLDQAQQRLARTRDRLSDEEENREARVDEEVRALLRRAMARQEDVAPDRQRQRRRPEP